MKKLISFVLILVVVLSVGTVAFADNNAVVITKDPTDEARPIGGTAWFVSGAVGYDTLTWNFMSTDGVKYSMQDFKKIFPYAVVEGENTTTLTLRNVSTDMNGWGVFCTFFNAGSPKDTEMAFLYVSNAYVQAPARSTTATSAPATYSYPIYYTYGQPLYQDAYGYYMPAHPSVYDEPEALWVDEYGTFTPAHPDADNYPTFIGEGQDGTLYFTYSDSYNDTEATWVDEYGTFTPAHPDP